MTHTPTGTPSYSIHGAYRVSDEHLADVEVAEAALVDPAMAHIVDMVLRRVDDSSFEAASATGRSRFHREPDGHGWRFVVDRVEGTDPIGDQSIDRFSPLDAERSNPFPDRSANAYPHAHEQVSQLFDAAAAPDLVAIHTAAHNWVDQGGHLGEHGSIGVVQARAPFICAGAGVQARGMVSESCQLVDIAPTVMALLGAEPCGGVGSNGEHRDDALLAFQDGEARWSLIDSSAPRPDHVVGVLVDGVNANVLYDIAARGGAPNIARLMAMGTSYAHGAISSMPTVTLANHTTILTGAHPGHHGILGNAWWDRSSSSQVVTNSPANWATSMDWLHPWVETLYQAVARAFPGSVTVSINEPCDTGADHSIFGLMRAGEPMDSLPPADDLPNATQRFVRPVKEYQWSSMVDHIAVEQARGIWGGTYRGRSWPLPRFTWVNFSLTDAAAHEGGPYSEIAAAGISDTDARIGEILASVEAAGVFDRTAFFVVADHGMEASDPGCTGNWADALDDCGVPYRDEGYTFIYVNPDRGI